MTKLADALGVEFTDLLKPGTLTLSVLRASRGLAQSDVAEALGVTQPWYHLVEAGTARVQPDQFARLARLFRVDDNTLVTLVHVRDYEDSRS